MPDGERVYAGKHSHCALAAVPTCRRPSGRLLTLREHLQCTEATTLREAGLRPSTCLPGG
ncbi:hypothetical protein [Chlorogloeopsis sp. ULAP02]|uniref:hypothetical protein n=1 Tax=Chlorogloeopsis sp. ULAP02 TaxID=3107926 RepID=UPI00313619B4